MGWAGKPRGWRRQSGWRAEGVLESCSFWMAKLTGLGDGSGIGGKGVWCQDDPRVSGLGIAVRREVFPEAGRPGGRMNWVEKSFPCSDSPGPRRGLGKSGEDGGARARGAPAWLPLGPQDPTLREDRASPAPAPAGPTQPCHTRSLWRGDLLHEAAEQLLHVGVGCCPILEDFPWAPPSLPSGGRPPATPWACVPGWAA